MCAKTIRATNVEETVGSSSSGSSASASVSRSGPLELLPAPQPAAPSRHSSNATTTPSPRLPTSEEYPLVHRSTDSESSPARIACAIRSMCSCSAISGGEQATPPSSGRISTPCLARDRGHARDRARVLLDRLGRERDGGEEAEAGAHLADRGVIGERRQRVVQRALELAPALDQPVALVDVEHRHGRRRSRSDGRRRWRRGGASCPPSKNGAATAPDAITPPSGR